MDNHHPLDYSGGGRPPRKELLGPRPAPLKVRKESVKIKKPPVAPPAGMPHQQNQPTQQQPRQPVIIYTVSPKVIHANPNEFMTLVQRLTGPDATSSSSMASHYVSGAISPAARFASIEKTKMPLEGKDMAHMGRDDEGIERARVFVPGILSPGPGSLPPISPNLFSPFFNDLNYGNNYNYSTNYNYQHEGNNNRNYVGGSSNYVASPFSTSNNNFTSPGAVISPGSLDLLHQILNG
ncbi:protein MKS1-like [Silene latifolia]|uniref:protein MKS1-like n=1 Tax=Silene latifolia TaxID=37657 RepID=UPI003D76EE79